MAATGTRSRPRNEADADRAAAYLARGGDVLAEILGNVLARVDDGDVSEHPGVLDAAHDAILEWHMLRARVRPAD